MTASTEYAAFVGIDWADARACRVPGRRRRYAVGNTALCSKSRVRSTPGSAELRHADSRVGRWRSAWSSRAGRCSTR